MEIHGSSLFIDLLAVDSRHQNKKLGTQLISRAESQGRTNGCKLAHLFVDDHNERALRFYFRHGYQIIRSIESLRVIELAKSLVD